MLWSYIHIQQTLTDLEFKTKLVGQIHDAFLLMVHPDEIDEVKEMIHQIAIIDVAEFYDCNIALKMDFEQAGVDESLNEVK